MRKPIARRKRTRGFTIVELMISIVAGLIAIIAIYSLAGGASRHFQEQQRVSQTQTALRLATEQLRADIERGGFGGTPNSRREASCSPPADQIQAVEFLDNEDTANLPFPAENLVEADVLRLVGNFATSGSYLIIGANAAGTNVQLQPSWQGFRRDFGVVGGAGFTAFDEATFQNVFAQGRRLHVESEQGFHFFPSILGTIPATQQILIMPGLPVMTPCLPGLADNAQVTPLVRVEYRVVNPRAPGSGLEALYTDNAASAALGLDGAVLIRREIDFSTNAPIPGTTRVVLEYVADFNIEFIVDTAGPGAAPILSNPPITGAPAEAMLERSATSRPEQVRSVIVSLSARSPDVDPRFPFIAARASRATPLSRYAVTSAAAGAPAARVRTMTSEIFLPNVAGRRLP